MFKNIFSFNGRIRRTEFGISLIIYFVLYVFILVFTGFFKQNKELLIAFVPMLWFLWAQGAKRCHDVGNNGWWQIIPFYVFWLLFQDGEPNENEYGENPKGPVFVVTDYQDPVGTPPGYYNQPVVDLDAAVLIALDDVAQIASDDTAYTDLNNDTTTDADNSGSSDDSSSYDDADSSSSDDMDSF
jgi:uncharacterized membrane protein YhaH (DUF805 family)